MTSVPISKPKKKRNHGSRPHRKRPGSSEHLVEIGKRPRWAYALDEREYLFVCAFGRHMNAAAAAREVGVSEKSAGQVGYLIISRPHVREAIHEMHLHRLPVIKVSMMERLMAIASANISDYVDWDGDQVRVKSKLKLSRDKTLAIKSIKEKRSQWGSTIELQMHDPLEAIQKLAGLLDLLPKPEAEKPGQPGIGNVTVIIEGLNPTSNAAVTIDHDMLRQSLKDNRSPDPDELPPGA